jgi:hypothetical protein
MDAWPADNRIELFSADCFQARPSITPRLYDLVLYQHVVNFRRLDLLHLWYESWLLSAITPLSNTIGDAWSRDAQDDTALSLQTVVVDFSTALAAWQLSLSGHPELPSSGCLALHSMQLEMMACLKITNDFVRYRQNPSIDQIGLIQCCRDLSQRTASSIIELVVHKFLIPARLPAYNLTLCFAAYALVIAGMRSGQTTLIRYPNDHDMSRYKELLIESHVAGEHYLDYLHAKTANVDTAIPTRVPSPTGDFFGNTFFGEMEGTTQSGPAFDLGSSWLFDTDWLVQFQTDNA